MPRKVKSKTTHASVEAVIHKKDKRANIPTRELADFVAKEEQAPYTLRYPRDPSLDPQLVWKGKDGQDTEDLAVPAVPIYIQEKIAPQALIENLRLEQKRVKSEQQANLFADFNGIEFEQLVEFYQHEQNWSNRMILGDSLLVMNSLAEKEGLKGKVQMIYIDPPYGINFGSNWQVSTRKRDVKDGKAADATRQPEQIKAFRDTWKLGIHSYLAYLRDRLVVARELLTETGSVFVQIGDENVHLVRCLLDEVFGSENFVSLITIQKTGQKDSKTIDSVSDYLLWFAKDVRQVKYRQLYVREKYSPLIHTDYKFLQLANGSRRSLTEEERNAVASIPVGTRPYQSVSLHSQDRNSNTDKPIVLKGQKYFCPSNRHWSNDPEVIEKAFEYGYVEIQGNTPRRITFYDEVPGQALKNIWADTMGADDPIYVVQTTPKVIQRCLLMTTDPGDLVLDPTCGSGTTAYVAEQRGRRWITIDTSRVALTLARTRLMSAKYPYYLLADSDQGVKKEQEITGVIGMQHAAPLQHDIKKGFVYKRVPHVTLKSIANNPDIKEGMTREEIDAAIARHAETEMLYDQPYEDKKRIRVSGPFTVESLSPHRVLAADEERPDTEREAATTAGPGQFETIILENLKKAGVQNTFKKQRLIFEHLESYAGIYLHGEGGYSEDGQTRRVAICIGPEHGTVGPELVKEAAKEAVKGVGFELLVVCGFAFDPHVSEEAKQFGNLIVLMAHMNPDLAMGDELLKKTGAGNLFMIFGEPDVKISKQKDGKYVVEIKGLDIYDPTTGQIRSHATDDIACWFIDTEYNGESFFVRHAYFCGADEPYKKLKRAMRAEIDEAAWSSLYATKSRPFDPPKKGKIAIKVINHYGDEILKVYQVQ